MSKNKNRKKGKNGDYPVGRGKPPTKTQFKPGQSGNPRGRPKGSRNFRTDFMEEMQTLVEITENGKKLKVSKQRALIKRMVNGSLNGDPKATALTIQLNLKFNDEDGEKENAKPLTKEEIEILKSHLESLEGEDDEQ